MTTRRGPKIRFLPILLFLALVAFPVAWVAVRTAFPSRDMAQADTTSDSPSEPIHPKSPPTDFYEQALVDPVPMKEVRFTPDQVSREFTLFLLVLNEGDLLADYCMLTYREFVDEDQLNEARAIARQYDDRLKDLRRERSQILEQAGVSIKDPTQRLERFRERAYRFFVEVSSRIMREVLTAKQREQIVEKNQQLRAAKKAADAKYGNAPAADGNPIN